MQDEIMQDELMKESENITENISENVSADITEDKPVNEETPKAEGDDNESNEESDLKLPENPLFETDVQMDTSVLYDYMLRHTYTSPFGLVATLLGCMSLMFFAKGAGGLYLVIGIVMIVYLPWNLFLSARKQALTVEAFKKPLHYAFTDEGVYISQSGSVQMQSWDKMVKAISTSKSIVLYTAKNAASIFPRKDLGDHTATLIEVISTHMPPKKVRIRR